MINLIVSEFAKLKRCSIFWIGITAVAFSVLLAAFQTFGTNNTAVVYQGLSDSVIWNNFSLVFPFTITLIGGYMINREYVDQTLKNLMTIPVSARALLTGKLIVLGFVTIGFSIFSFICTLVTAVLSGCDGINTLTILLSLRQIVGMGICCFIAVLPIIIAFTKKVHGFLAGVGFSFVYGFCGIFIAGRGLQDFYPITAGLGLIGYGGNPGSGAAACHASLGLSILLAIVILTVLMLICVKRHDNGVALPNGSRKKRTVKRR